MNSEPTMKSEPTSAEEITTPAVKVKTIKHRCKCKNTATMRKAVRVAQKIARRKTTRNY